MKLNVQRTLMNRRTLTPKDYPKNKDVILEENAKCWKQRRKNVAPRFYSHPCNRSALVTDGPNDNSLVIELLNLFPKKKYTGFFIVARSILCCTQTFQSSLYLHLLPRESLWLLHFALWTGTRLFLAYFLFVTFRISKMEKARSCSTEIKFLYLAVSTNNFIDQN